MTVGDAKRIASEWVRQEASMTDGFSGAFFAGSINSKQDGETLPGGSDVDVFVVIDREDVSELLTTKLSYNGVIVEPAYYPLSEFRNPEATLGDYRVACHLTVPSIITDPRSVLAELQPVVQAEYARRKWIRRRCEALRDEVIQLSSPETDWPTAPFVLATGWAAFTTFAPRIVALADLRDPTAKRSLVVSREILARYEELEIQDRFFEVLGIAELPASEAHSCLRECIDVLDVAITHYKTPSLGGNFVSPPARELLLRGVEEMFDSGYYREVINFLDMVFIINMFVLWTDAPAAVRATSADAFRGYMRHHRIYSDADHKKRAALARTSLTELMSTAERIVQANDRAFD